MNSRALAQCALFTALMCVCAWISIPLGDMTFSMQTFALFLTLLLLGGKKGCIVCLLYLLLGAVGLPIFTGFRGGLGVLSVILAVILIHCSFSFYTLVSLITFLR